MNIRKYAAISAGVLVAYLLAAALLPHGVPVEVIVPGILYGGLSGLSALALILVFRSSRVVNFAQASMGGLCSTFVVMLVSGGHVSYWVAVPLGLVAAAAIGLGVGWFQYRVFGKAPRLIATVATIAIAQVLYALTVGLRSDTIDLFGRHLDNPLAGPDSLATAIDFRLPSSFTFNIGSLVLRADHILAAVVVVALLVALTWFYQRTDFGIGTRAAADSPERALLLGISVRRLILVSWVIAGLLAGVSAILTTGVDGFQSNVPTGPAVLVIPLVAAVVAGFERLSVAFLVSVGLGLVQQAIAWNYADTSLTDITMFGLMMLALVFRYRADSRVGAGDVDGFTGVSEVRPLPASVARDPKVVALRWTGLAVALVVLIVVPLGLSTSGVTFFSFVAVYVVIGCSLTMLSGWAGAISLCQFGIVGIGAGVTGWLLAGHQQPLVICFLASIAAGSLIALVIGMAALRIRGMYLAVATLAFAAPASTFFLNSSRFPALAPLRIDPPILLGQFDLNQARPFYYLCALAALASLAIVRNFRTSRIGRVTIAVRDNERFAAAAGISGTRVRLTAFAASGCLAGLAGSLYALALRGIPANGFAPELSITLFTLVVIGGMGSAWGAILGALFVYGSQYYLGDQALLLTNGLGLLLILWLSPGGLAGLGYRLRDRVVSLVVAGKWDEGILRDRDEVSDPAENVRPSLTGNVQTGNLLQLEGVEAGYGHLKILFGVTVGVDERDTFAFLGTNGAGKSTILNVIAGLLPTTAGRVTFDGENLAGLSPEERVERGIVLVPGGRGVFGGLSVAENLRLAGWLARRRGEHDFLDATRERIDALFPVLGERAGQRAELLSGGEQQMLTIAQALLCKPKLLMIDELSLGLAPAVVGQLLDVLRTLNTEGMTIILVEQSMNVAVEIAPRAIFLEKGQLRFAGPTAELAATKTLVRSVFFADARPARPEPAVRTLPDTTQPALSVRGLSKAYGGICAVEGVDLDLPDGAIMGVIGANGAGKTTLFDLICGFTPADSGTVHLRGRDISGFGAARRFGLGLGRTFQDLRLVPSLTVLELVSVALDRHLEVRDPVSGLLALPASLESEDRARQDAEELIKTFHLERHANAFVSELSTGTRRVVELAAVMAHKPKVLILDEPSSGLAQQEAEGMVPLLLEARERLGASIAIIEHDIPMIRSLSDTVVCMHLGAVLAQGSADEVLSNPDVIASYLGVDEVTIERSGKGRSAARTAPAAIST